ncbi:hypothetical protein ACT7DO_14200 [Bacillus pacificus]
MFVIELPPYRVPQAKTLWLSTWEKGEGICSQSRYIYLRWFCCHLAIKLCRSIRIWC